MRWLAALLLVSASVALAEAPENSVRPEGRVSPQAVEAAVGEALSEDLRPQRRAVEDAVVQAMAPVVTVSAPRTLVFRSPRPIMRPDNLRRRSVVAASGMRVSLPKGPIRGGPVCGFGDVVGERLQNIPGRLRGCGVENPVRIGEVAGVRLSQPAVMDCLTVAAFRNWVEGGAKPAVGRLGGGLARLEVAAHYACRTRNNRPGAKISEHGKGRAIDISAFTLANGTKITLLRGWRDPNIGPRLKKMWRAACGPFGTVLGPNADRYHQDHFHFDTARYRSGSYCR